MNGNKRTEYFQFMVSIEILGSCLPHVYGPAVMVKVDYCFSERRGDTRWTCGRLILPSCLRGLSHELAFLGLSASLASSVSSQVLAILLMIYV